MAYPQADIETGLYMKLPPGIKVNRDDGQIYVLRVLKNIYSQKQAGCVWYNHLWKGSTIFLCYVDDGIFASSSKEEVNQAIKDLRR
eukprot:4297236-Ditylum_brightwellii.AAC.1